MPFLVTSVVSSNLSHRESFPQERRMDHLEEDPKNEDPREKKDEIFDLLSKRDKSKKKKHADVIPITDGHAIIYIRVSTMKQVGTDHVSIETQEAMCRRWADENKVPLYPDGVIPGSKNGVVSDLGKSGTSTKSRNILSVIGNLVTGDTLIVYDASRLTRDSLASKLIEINLIDRGINLISVSQQSSSILAGAKENPEGTFMRQIISAMNEYEAGKTSVRVKQSLREKRLRGEVVGRIPFGKTVLEGTKKLIDNPDEMPTVRRIQVYRESTYPVVTSRGKFWRPLTFPEIAEILNFDCAPFPGTRTLTGTGWNKDSVRMVYNRSAASLKHEDILPEVLRVEYLLYLSYVIINMPNMHLMDKLALKFNIGKIARELAVPFSIEKALTGVTISSYTVPWMMHFFEKYISSISSDIPEFRSRCLLAEDDEETTRRKILAKFGISVPPDVLPVDRVPKHPAWKSHTRSSPGTRALPEKPTEDDA